MHETAGGWLDERLDAEPGWTRADADLVTAPDLEAEAGALLDRVGDPGGDSTTAVLDRDDSWLAAGDVGLGDPVGPAEQIVVVADEVADALAAGVGELGASDDGTWLSIPLDPAPAAPGTSVDDADSGIVDPFDVFLATTEPSSRSEDPVGEPVEDTAAGDEPSPGNDAVVDDIAPSTDEPAEIERQPASADGERDVGGTSDAPHAAEAPLVGESGPSEGQASRLDAFDALDPADAIESTDPGGLGLDVVADAESVEDLSDDVGGDVG